MKTLDLAQVSYPCLHELQPRSLLAYFWISRRSPTSISQIYDTPTCVCTHNNLRASQSLGL